MAIKFINKVLGRLGWRLQDIKNSLPEDIHQDEDFKRIYNKCRPYTMTSVERMYQLYMAVTYVIKNEIKGSFVECGVWKGGSSMLIAETLMQLGVTDRELYLYDTFDGMSEPDENDLDLQGISAQKQLENSKKSKQESVWCYSPQEEVKENMLRTKYPESKLHLIKGKVEETIPGKIPVTIALLRLDTDWYTSTKHELEYLYPLLSNNGPLIIDDFGHWEGAKKAVIEFFLHQDFKPLISRIDYTGRIVIKSAK